MFSNLVFDDLEIANEISAILLNKKKPLSLEQIRTELKHKTLDNERLNFLFSKYQKHFQLFEQPLVKLVTKVGICKAHCTKGTDCSGISTCCSGLHICKFYFLSGKCKWGRNCTYGHDLNLDHNKKILRNNLLDNISVDDLKYILRLAINRTALTIPRICKFYNVENNKCRHTKAGSACPDLHICKHYVSNTCQYDKHCRRNHNVKDERNKNILSKHGIDTSKPESEIIQELRNVISTKQEDCSSTRRTDNPPTASTSSTIPIMANLKKETDMVGTLETTDAAWRTVNTVIKREVSRDDPVFQRSDSPGLHVNVTTNFVHFRYKSELMAIEKRSKARKVSPDTFNRNCVADISVDNYDGNATVVAYCVDVNNKVHPYYLYGDNCKDGVFVKKCKMEPETHVNLQGISVCTPKKVDYQSIMKKTTTYLNQIKIHDVEMCEKLEDKNSVCLTVTVILEDNSVLSKVIPLHSKKSSKEKDENLTQGQKRALEDPPKRDSKKPRHDYNQSSDEIKDPVPKPFQRLYSKVGVEDQWGNFIDTTGYEESALMWKAQGEALHSVCMICFPEGSGTGFRVGIRRGYVMTAGHIYDFMLRSGCGAVGKRRHSPLLDRCVYAVFGYLKEGEVKESNKFYFKDKLVFRNYETDCVVLELEENRHGLPMPPALTNFRKTDFTQEFFLVGHSEGKPLGINKVHKVVNIESAKAQIDIKNVIKMSLEHTKCQAYPDGRGYEVLPHQILQSPHRFLFHCKFTKGASGSPGLVFLKDGRIVVVSMLLCGYPDWYYDPDPLMKTFRTNWSRESWCVEQGVNLQSVYDFMTKTDPKLVKEIFPFN